MRLRITIITLLLTLGGALSAQAAKEKFNYVKVHLAAQAVDADRLFAAEAVLLHSGRAAGVVHLWRAGGPSLLLYRVVGGEFDENDLLPVRLELVPVGDPGERVERAEAWISRDSPTPSALSPECLIWEIREYDAEGNLSRTVLHAATSIRFGDGERGRRPPSDS